MQLVEQTTISTSISLKDCVDAIYQINCYPRDICELIAQFTIFKHCKVYSVMSYIDDQYENKSSCVAVFQMIISQLNTRVTWSNYPIAKGDMVIISTKNKAVAFFDGRKLISVYKFIDHSEELYSSIILLPKTFDILNEFYFGYWDFNPAYYKYMYACVDLNKYKNIISSNKMTIRYNKDIHIEWSYFTHNGGLILVYLLARMNFWKTSLECIIEDYTCVTRPIPWISSLLEKQTSICPEYCWHIGTSGWTNKPITYFFNFLNRTVSSST